MQPLAEETTEHPSPIAARMMLVALPDYIREAFERRAAEIEYPQELRSCIKNCPPTPNSGGAKPQSPPELGDLGGKCVSPDPIESVLEVALAGFLNAGFLNGECLSFSDCQPRY